MGHTFTHLLFHIVFSTKDRLPLLDARRGGFAPVSLSGWCYPSARQNPAAIHGPNDHLYSLVKLRASISMAEVVEKMKSNSSGWIQEE